MGSNEGHWKDMGGLWGQYGAMGGQWGEPWGTLCSAGREGRAKTGPKWAGPDSTPPTVGGVNVRPRPLPLTSIAPLTPLSSPPDPITVAQPLPHLPHGPG